MPLPRYRKNENFKNVSYRQYSNTGYGLPPTYEQVVHDQPRAKRSDPIIVESAPIKMERTRVIVIRGEDLQKYGCLIALLVLVIGIGIGILIYNAETYVPPLDPQKAIDLFQSSSGGVVTQMYLFKTPHTADTQICGGAQYKWVTVDGAVSFRSTVAIYYYDRDRKTWDIDANGVNDGEVEKCAS